jgi:hypothetical protein
VLILVPFFFVLMKTRALRQGKLSRLQKKQMREKAVCRKKQMRETVETARQSEARSRRSLLRSPPRRAGPVGAKTTQFSCAS